MSQISVKLPEQLHEQLLKKGRQMGVDNISDTVRMLLLWALENQDAGLSKTDSDALLYQIKNYVIKIHCLVEEGFVSLVQGGEGLKDKAHAKADKLISGVEKKSS